MKFNDSELIGIPTIVVIGKRLADGVVEIRTAPAVTATMSNWRGRFSGSSSRCEAVESNRPSQFADLGRRRLGCRGRTATAALWVAASEGATYPWRCLRIRPSGWPGGAQVCASAAAAARGSPCCAAAARSIEARAPVLSAGPKLRRRPDWSALDSRTPPVAGQRHPEASQLGTIRSRFDRWARRASRASD